MPQGNDVTAAPAPQSEAPRFASAWAALVLAAATLTLAYPALAGGFLVMPHSDQYIAGYAFREFAAASLRTGEGFPQWNPYLFGGMPYIAAMHGDIFYPTFLLRMLLPTDIAMTWGFVIHTFLAGFFTYQFLRAWGIGFYGAVIGGLAYMLSGPIAGYASPGHDGKLFVSSLLPLSLWMLVRLIRDGRLWAWGVFTLTVGLAFLSPHPQLFQYLLLASGTFTLYLAFASHDAGKLHRRVAFSRMGLALAAVLVGIVIGAVQYLPSLLTYEQWSPRAGGAGWEHAISYSMPIEELLNAFVPQFTGILDNYWGRNGIHFHSEYPGIVVLVLAGAGMFAATQRRSFRWFWIGTFVISLLWALGGNTPFYRLVYAVVPYTKYLRAPSTMMFLSMFALSVLAAVGAERVILAAGSVSKRFMIGWPAAVALLGMIMIGGLAVTVAQGIGAAMAPMYPQYQPADIIRSWAERARANQGDLTLGMLRSLAFALLAIAAIWAIARRRISPVVGAWTLAGLVVMDLWSIERLYWQFSPRASVIYGSDAAIDALKERTAREPGRILTVDVTRSAVPRDPAFTDALMTHRLRLVGGYHGNELGMYQQLTSGDVIFKPAFWRHENVHYLYTTLPDSLLPQVQAQLGLAEPLEKVAGPVKNARGSTVYVYRLPGANPAAWVASTMVKGTPEEALATVLDPRFDGQRAAIFDTTAAVNAAQVTTVPAPSGVEATVTRLEPGRIDVTLAKPAPAGAALVVSENFYPGWRATADGNDATVGRANFNLIGVALPEGARAVELRFTDAAYQKGKLITLIALAIALLGTVGGAFLDRRPAHAAA